MTATQMGHPLLQASAASYKLFISLNVRSRPTVPFRACRYALIIPHTRTDALSTVSQPSGAETKIWCIRELCQVVHKIASVALQQLTFKKLIRTSSRRQQLLYFMAITDQDATEQAHPVCYISHIFSYNRQASCLCSGEL